MKKRLWALVLALLLLAAVPATAGAGSGSVLYSGSCGSGVSYVLYDSGALHITGSGAMTDNFTFPFDSGSASPVTSVTVGRGVTHIGAAAFKNFRNLTAVSLSSTVRSLGASAFEQCRALTAVTIPEGVTALPKRAFYNCRYLTAVTLPSTLRSIGTEAFMYCLELPVLTIPEGVTTIESKTFGYCTALQTVHLPSTLTTIRLNAFAYSGLTSITLPNSVRTIGSYAFMGTKLTSIALPEGMTMVDDFVFQDCSRLQTVHLPATVTTIGQAAFAGCGFESLYLPDTVTVMGRYALQGCAALQTVRLPGSLVTLSEGLLADCAALQTLGLPNTLTTVSANALRGCAALREVYYNATAQRWAEVTVEAGNEALKSAAWRWQVTFTRQPQSVRTIAGRTAVFSVSTDRTAGLSYCWQYSSGSGWKNCTLTGCDTAQLTVADVSAYENCYFRCVVTDLMGAVAVSQSAQLTLVPAPVITVQPVGVTVAKGATARTAVTASGEGLSYAWYVRDRDDTAWWRSTITAAQYAVTMTVERMGRQVYCVVTDSYGRSVRSHTVTLGMIPSPLEITAQPVGETVAKNAAAAVEVKAEGDGLSYTWYVRDRSDGDWWRSSLTTARYSVTMTPARRWRQVYCVVTDIHGRSVRSDTVTLDMVPTTLAITAQPVSVSVDAGKTAQVSITAVGDGLTYQWYYVDDHESGYDRGVHVPNRYASAYTDVGHHKSSYTGSTYSITMTEERAGRRVYCVVTDAYGLSVQSETVTLGMN